MLVILFDLLKLNQLSIHSFITAIPSMGLILMYLRNVFIYLLQLEHSAKTAFLFN